MLLLICCWCDYLFIILLLPFSGSTTSRGSLPPSSEVQWFSQLGPDQTTVASPRLTTMASVAQNGLPPQGGLSVQTPSAHIDSTSKQNDGFGGYESESADEEGEFNETKIAILEAVFLLHTEIPFFLKNISRVFKPIVVTFWCKTTGWVETTSWRRQRCHRQ